MHDLAKAVAMMLPVVLASLPALACGTERWAVKVGTDPDAASISTDPTWSTIADLGQLDAPRDPNERPDTRWPEERKVYQVAGTLVMAKHEADGDYHLVVQDDAGHEMIAEAPDPACAEKGAWSAQIAQVRAAIEKRLGETATDHMPILNAPEATTDHMPVLNAPAASAGHMPILRAIGPRPRQLELPVSLVGVLFWDSLHGQAGHAPNGGELHPLLGFTIEDSDQ